MTSHWTVQPKQDWNPPETFAKEIMRRKQVKPDPPYEQLSFDHATTSNIYAAIQQLQQDVAQIKAFIAETPELLKDVVEQMHSVLSALDDIEAASRS